VGVKYGLTLKEEHKLQVCKRTDNWLALRGVSKLFKVLRNVAGIGETVN
jgi:hypothetical protein